MKKPVVIIYSIIISFTLIFAIGLFGYNIYTDYNKGSTVAENRFERMALSIKQIPENVDINSHNFENLIIKAINGIDNYSTLKIEINNQTYLAYPTENDKQPGSSKLVVNKTKEFNLHGNDVKLTADLYVLTPSVINQDVKISFGIILFATVLTLFMILLDTLIGDSGENKKRENKTKNKEYVIDNDIEYIAPENETKDSVNVAEEIQKEDVITEPLENNESHEICNPILEEKEDISDEINTPVSDVQNDISEELINPKIEEKNNISEEIENNISEEIENDISEEIENDISEEIENDISEKIESELNFEDEINFDFEMSNTEEEKNEEVNPEPEKRYNLISEELANIEKISPEFEQEDIQEKENNQLEEEIVIGKIDFVEPEAEESSEPELPENNDDVKENTEEPISRETVIDEPVIEPVEEKNENITEEKEERKPSETVTSIFIPKFESDGKNFEITSIPKKDISMEIENKEIEEYKNQLENDEVLPLPSDDIKPAVIKNTNSDPVGLYSPVTGFGWESYLNNRLENELNRATASEIDLSLFVIQLKDVLRTSDMTQEFCKYLSSQFQFRDMIFEYKDDCYVAIKIGSTIDDSIPFANKLLLDIDNILKGMGKCYIGISSRSIRMVGAERLIAEAEKALIHASEEKDSPIIAFRVDADKYRKYLEENN